MLNLYLIESIKAIVFFSAGFGVRHYFAQRTIANLHARLGYARSYLTGLIKWSPDRVHREAAMIRGKV